MGRAPYDEPSVLALALNDVFVPILRRVFPEIADFIAREAVRIAWRS